MGRMLFGGGSAEIYLYEDDEGDLRPYGPVEARFFDGPGEQAGVIVDLVTLDEVPVDKIIVPDQDDETARGQLPMFLGPDDVYEMWMSVNSSPRQLIQAVNTGSNLFPTKQAIDSITGGSDPNPFDTALTDLLDVDGEAVAVASEGSSLVKLPSGLYGPGSSPIPLSDTLWVAASDAPANFQGAPYVCDGTDDHVQINEALNNSFGLKVGLSPGNFDIGDPLRMRYTSNPATGLAAPKAQFLIGAGQSVSKLNVRSGVNAGIYIYDNVGAHIWDLTINVVNQRAIWAFRPGGATAGYRSMLNGSVRRVTIAGPSGGTHNTWAASFKSPDRITIEEVTVQATQYGLEIVTEEATQRFGEIVFRNCRVTLVGDGGQCYRTGNDAGEFRGITFDTCTATVVATTQATTEGFRIQASGGQTYGVNLINCTSFGLVSAITTSANVSDVNADFALVETKQGGSFAVAAGTASNFRCREFRVPSSVTTATIMTDTGAASMPNQYWYHIYTQGSSAVSGTLGNAIVRRGLAEGFGTVLPATLKRNPNQQISRTDIDPIEIPTGSVGSVNTNFTVLDNKIRTGLGGKYVYGWFRLRSTNAITPTNNNMPDTLMYTLNTAYRPSENIHVLWSTGPATGTIFINASTGNISIITGNQTITASAILTFSFAFLKD